MPEEQNPNPVTPPQPNTPEARTPTGELKPVVTTPTVEPTTPIPAKTPEPTEPPRADDKTLLSKDDKTKPAPAVVPEKYEFKAPDGFEIDAKFVTEATPLLKELGLSNDQAQKLVDMQIARERLITEGAYKLYDETRKGWQKEVFNDPALGDGTQLKADVKARISSAIDMLPNAAEFRKTMDLTGAGDNPAFVKAWDWIAKQIGEGSAVRGGGPSKLGQTQPGAAPKSAASALYPNLPSSSNG